jgi:insertion element IS1 protein InsB
LRDKIKELIVRYFASDYWKSYEEFIPSDKHLQTKAETFTVEGYNSRIRHYLSGFHRKTKCYSKAGYGIVLAEIMLHLCEIPFHSLSVGTSQQHNPAEASKFINVHA